MHLYVSQQKSPNIWTVQTNSFVLLSKYFCSSTGQTQSATLNVFTAEKHLATFAPYSEQMGCKDRSLWTPPYAAFSLFFYGHSESGNLDAFFTGIFEQLSPQKHRICYHFTHKTGCTAKAVFKTTSLGTTCFSLGNTHAGLLRKAKELTSSEGYVHCYCERHKKVTQTSHCY